MQYALPGNLTAGIQHGSWTMPVTKGRTPEPSFLNSSQHYVQEDLQYSNEDIKHIEDWTKRMSFPLANYIMFLLSLTLRRPRRDHLALPRHLLNGT
jgi:hypothetical protein